MRRTRKVCGLLFSSGCVNCTSYTTYAQIVVLGADVLKGKPSWGQDGIYILIGLLLGLTVLQERSGHQK